MVRGLDRRSAAASTRPADVLGRFVTRPAPEAVDERCELCAAPLPPQHPHLVEIRERRIACSCPPCALLFDHRGEGSRFKRVPSRRRRVRDPQLGPDFWERLRIPVRLAFVFENSAEQRVAAFYPGPAGATESLLPRGAWEEVVSANPVLGSLEADVEAVLLRHPKDGALECHLVPIDLCYALTGTVRRTWKGFEGGAEAWREIDAFFAGLAAEAVSVARGDPS